MGPQGLGTLLVLLAAVVAVVAAVRRLHLPPILGYLAVGMALGPHALSVVPQSPTTSFLADIGVVFLLFTLGLEFSLPRMMAMRGEVFGLGTLQVGLTTLASAALAFLAGAPPVVAVVIGGAVAMSSTAIVLRQLTEQAEINRTHGRLAFSILLFQDVVFVLFLALANALVAGGEHTAGGVLLAVGKAAIGLLVVLIGGRRVARPLFFEIAHSRGQELFTLAVLLVALASAWLTDRVGLSLALGGFLAGMLLAETEYRHQVEAVIRPFRDVLLGLFFITIGMLLDLGQLGRHLLAVSALVVGMYALKTLVVALVARRYCDSWFKSLRAGLVVGAGGEFGFALLALLVGGRVADGGLAQPLLAAVTLSMVVSPFVIRHNKRIARWLLNEQGPATTALAREAASEALLARREHVIVCGFGRVGQSVARVLERHGHEFIAIDVDPGRVRAARQAGDPVAFGDSADAQVLQAVGIDAASVVVVTFADADIAAGIVREVRRLRADVPVLVRAADDSHLEALQQAGATEVVPETFEASLMMVAHVLLFLDTPMSSVVRTVGEIRSERYVALRSVFRPPDSEHPEGAAAAGAELRTVVLPPGAWSIGRTLGEVHGQGAEVTFSAIRREGIVGRDPDPATVLREGDVVIVFGSPEALEHAEAVLLAG